MTETLALDLIRNAFLNIIKVAGPVMVAAMVVGLVISILQATTQVQEQTLSFVPKLLVVIVALILLGSFMMNSMIDFFKYALDIIPKL